MRSISVGSLMPVLNEKIPGGYMLVAKKIFNSELMKKPPLYSKLFLWMLGQAAFKDTKNLKRGEFVTTIAEMQEAMSHFVGYRKETPTVKQIRNIYEGLAKGYTIGTTKGTRGLKVTILNYEYYQNARNYEGHDERVHGGHTKVITGGVTPIKEKEKKEKRNTYSTKFQQLWAAYPKKTDKKKSWLKWQSMNGERPDIETLLSAIEKQKLSRSWKEGFIPHMTTWLNGARWEDEVEILKDDLSEWEWK